MKKILALITITAIAALLIGCASTKFDKLGVQERTVKFSILGGTIIDFEKTTIGLEVNGAEIIKEDQEQ